MARKKVSKKKKKLLFNVSAVFLTLAIVGFFKYGLDFVFKSSLGYGIGISFVVAFATLIFIASGAELW
jgi:hypothetical protein